MRLKLKDDHVISKYNMILTISSYHRSNHLKKYI